MKRADITRKKLALALIVLAGLLFLRFAWPASRVAGSPEAQNVNLALRRTAHYLLAASGDSTSRIPPVQQTDANTWLIRLERPFDYDRLPQLLQQSLEVQGIRGDYNVAVLRCSDGELQLGYNFLDFKQTREAACGGREMSGDCYNLRITFVRPAEKAPPVVAWTLAIGLLGGIFYAAWRFAWRRPAAAAPDADDSNRVVFGNSSLDPVNQTLTAAGVRHDLTYREAKLLHLFANHPNQLLERDVILQQVWADEGVLVGRSVDVFVSRLRKLLRDDPALRIVAVHGVGYRLETSQVS